VFGVKPVHVTSSKFDPRPMPKIGSLSVADNFCIDVEWAEGPRTDTREIIDLTPMIFRYKIYKPLRKQSEFSKVQLSDDGEMLEWDDGNIDMPATNVEYLAEQQMTGREFDAFLSHHKLTRLAASAIFGKSLRCIQDYVKTDAHIPLTMALACKGYEVRENSKAKTIIKGFCAKPTSNWDTSYTQSNAEQNVIVYFQNGHFTN